MNWMLKIIEILASLPSREGLQEGRAFNGIEAMGRMALILGKKLKKYSIS